VVAFLTVIPDMNNQLTIKAKLGRKNVEIRRVTIDTPKVNFLRTMLAESLLFLVSAFSFSFSFFFFLLFFSSFFLAKNTLGLVQVFPRMNLSDQRIQE
jgi:hypothetical protein